MSALSLFLFLFTFPATLILLSRLIKGARRIPLIAPKIATTEDVGKVSVIVPTLNEVDRIGPCLKGLSEQGQEVQEILIIDSNSQDGTRELVTAAQEKEPRLRLLTDAPLPQNWVGRPWALHNGFLASSWQSEWILGIDADTEPQGGLVAGLVAVAEAKGYDILSLSPQFKLQYPGEWCLQPALLMTLLYRFDPAGTDALLPERVMANGQCFLSRRSVLEKLKGYEAAKSSFCDDVTLARYAAQMGYKVGFLDGQKVIKVRMYEGAKETWEEWGRSLDLKDASSRAQIWGDLWLLFSVQALPLPLVILYSLLVLWGYHSLTILLVLGLNSFLLLIRIALLFAIKGSYDRTSNTLASQLFWLSPLADILAVYRIYLSSLQTPKNWRGRVYS